MKKTIFTFSFIIICLFLSTSFVFATGNNFENIKNNMVDTVNNAGNVVQDTASGAAGAVKDGTNAIGNGAQNVSNGVTNAGENMVNDAKNMGNNVGDAMKDGMENMNYTATRTSTDTNANNTTAGMFNNNIWTWIIVGLIAIVVIGLIWYYVSQNNH